LFFACLDLDRQRWRHPHYGLLYRPEDLRLLALKQKTVMPRWPKDNRSRLAPLYQCRHLVVVIAFQPARWLRLLWQSRCNRRIESLVLQRTMKRLNPRQHYHHHLSDHQLLSGATIKRKRRVEQVVVFRHHLFQLQVGRQNHRQNPSLPLQLEVVRGHIVPERRPVVVGMIAKLCSLLSPDRKKPQKWEEGQVVAVAL
jgi:hypothetical protein